MRVRGRKSVDSALDSAVSIFLAIAVYSTACAARWWKNDWEKEDVWSIIESSYEWQGDDKKKVENEFLKLKGTGRK